MALFTYQRRCLDQVAGHHKNGKVRVLVVSPTGSGKGHMAAHLIRECIEPHRGGAGKRALFIVHSRDIVRDMADRLRSQGVASVGVLMGGTVGDASAMVQVCTVQSLARVKAWAVDLVIVDEAHHYPRTSNWAAAARRFKARRVVGFTATPERRDGSPLGGKRGFEEMVVAAQYSELMAQEKPRVLAPNCRVMIPEHPVGKGRAMTPDQAYLRYAKGRFAFVYAANTAEVPRVTARLKRAGIKAVAVLGTTDKDERDRAIADLRAGRIQVIVNFETMTEGVDCPRVDTVVVGRRVTHVGKWIQMAGRAMRHYDGKAEALVLDCSGAYLKTGFGDPSADREFSLTRTAPISLDPAAARHIGPDADGSEQACVARKVKPTGPETKDIQLVDAIVRGSVEFVKFNSSLFEKKSDAEVAKILGLTTHQVWRARAAIGKRSGYDRRALRESGSRIVAMYGDAFGRESDRSIAKRAGVRRNDIRRIRTKLGIGAYKPANTNIDWSSVDFSRGDLEIARELGCTDSGVWRARRRLGHTRPPQTTIIDWSSVDFSRSNSELAGDLGCTTSCVYKARRRLRAGSEQGKAAE